jgi:Tfp pilus assembly protein PilF
MRAVSLLSRKDYNEALAQAKRAHQLEPKNVDIQNTYGRIAMEVNQYDLARKMLSAPAKDNTYREAYKSLTSLGIINYRENKLSAAQADFNRAIQLEPVNSCIAYYYLGNIYQKQKDFETAIRKFKLASESLCAGFSDAHLALAYAYEKAGETGKAKKKYLEVKGLFPNSSASQTAIDKLSKLP